MVQQGAAPGTGAGTAVIASPSAEECAALAGILSSGGLSTVVATTVDVLLEKLLLAQPDVLLVDLDIALGYADLLPATIAEHPVLRSLPVILLLPADGSVPLVLESYVSDVLFRPVRAAELLQRTRSVVSRRCRRREQQERTIRLREHMRRISARVRATNAPGVMIEEFLPDLGPVLGADHLALQIFDDDRVAARSSSWSNHTGPDTRPLAPPSGAHQEAALPLALSLWEGSTTSRFGRPPAGTSTTPSTMVPDWMTDDAGRALGGVVAPLGEGDTPFGLLWIVGEAGELEWSPTTGGLTQHVLGNLAHGLIQAQLISRQQEAVRELRALNRAKSDFVGTVNHELRTPLASITGYLEMINDGLGGELPSEASTMLQAVERNTTKLSELIENISALSTREPDASEHGPVDLVHLVSEVIGRSLLNASVGGVGLVRTIPEHAVLVSGHHAQLATALGIILSNAVTFTQEGGQVFVDLELAPDGEAAVVVMRDTGIGIPPEDLPRLFDSFQRGSNASHARPGAGVGLSVAKRTIEAHRGTITIDSTLGVGTAVSVSLPTLDRAHAR